MKTVKEFKRFSSYEELKSNQEKYNSCVIAHYVTPCYVVELMVLSGSVIYTIYTPGKNNKFLKEGSFKLPSKERKLWKLADRAVSKHVKEATDRIQMEFQDSWVSELSEATFKFQRA